MDQPLIPDLRLQVADHYSLLDYLCSQMAKKRTAVKNLLKYGAVIVNGEPVRQFDHPLSPGDEVWIIPLPAAAATSRLKKASIQPIYEDDALIVVEKPCGLLTVANGHDSTDTLFARLNHYLRDRDLDRPSRAFVVHRLDQETSGLVLFAKSARVKDALQSHWKDVVKTYCAVVQGCPSLTQGTITSHLYEDRKSLNVYSRERAGRRTRLATTHYRVLKSAACMSIVELRLETGRKHQIRVHLASLGCPVVGDRRYGLFSKGCKRLALHASGLELDHPDTGERLEFSSPMPKVLQKLVP